MDENGLPLLPLLLLKRERLAFTYCSPSFETEWPAAATSTTVPIDWNSRTLVNEARHSIYIFLRLPTSSVSIKKNAFLFFFFFYKSIVVIG